MTTLLARLFSRPDPADDQPADRATDRVAGPAADRVRPAGADLQPEAQGTAPPGRRDRALAGGHQVLVEGVSEKLLHAWLQNRHQTLFPLTVNLRALDPDQAAALAGWAAVSAHATRSPAEAGRGAEAAREWLRSVGADAATLAALDAAIAGAPPLDRALAAVHGLAAYAYVAALVLTDPRDPAAQPFLDYVAARLALPATVVRSAVRRYRR